MALSYRAALELWALAADKGRSKHDVSDLGERCVYVVGLQSGLFNMTQVISLH